MKPSPGVLRLFVAGLLFAAPTVGAATFIVTNTANDGAGSLRQAVQDAKQSAGQDVIVFDLPGTGPHVISLTTSAVNIDSDIAILNDRAGDELVTIEGMLVGNSSHLVVGVFTVANGCRAVLAGLTLRHGYSAAVISNGGFVTLGNCTLSDNGGGVHGGAIEYKGTELTLLNCLFVRNRASSGGAIYYSGVTDQVSVLTATNCVFTDNVATDTTSGAIGGGAIFAFGAFDPEKAYQSTNLALTNCTFTNNQAGHGGGAIFDYGYNGNANINAVKCTFSDNKARTGGAIYHDSELAARGVMKFENCTFSNNVVQDGGGAINVYKIYSGGEGFARVNNCTFSANSSPIISSRIRVELSNSVLARGSSIGTQLYGAESHGHNLSDDAMGGNSGTAPGGVLNGPGDVRNTNPQLMPLADNGGFTLTHALSPTSPAINAGDDTLAPSVDQRNYSRAGVSDIGAFEFGGTPAPVGPPAPTPSPTPTPSVPPHDPLAVINTNSSGDGSLRAAIQYANSSPSNDTIRFEIPGPGPHVINLATQLPTLTYPVQILNEGFGAKSITVRRSTAPEGSIFFVGQGNNVVIAGLTISNGKARSPGPDRGAGIYNYSGTLTLRNCVITGNSAIYGGGIYNTTRGGGAANLTLVDCTLSNNNTTGGPGEGGDGGGAIYNDATPSNDATVTLTNCSLVNNSSYREGGAIYNRSAGGNAIVVLNNCTVKDNAAPSGAGVFNRGRVTANGCTFSGNTTSTGTFSSDGVGGALDQESGTTQLSNSTVSGNTARSGGGIFTSGTSTVNVINTTITRNVATQPGTFSPSAGGIGNAGSPSAGSPNNGSSVVNLQNTILALNTSASGRSNGAGPFNSQGNNLVGDASGSTGFSNGVNNDKVGSQEAPVDPKLGGLQSNGGTTQTCALLAGSPAIDSGNDATAPGSDQRGYPRSGNSDIGAYEFGAEAPVRLGNISTRLRSGTGDNALIAGFIVTGTQPKKVIVRALGPSLASLGIAEPLADPTLELYGPSGLMDSNDDWHIDHEAEIAATKLQPTDDKEPAIVATLPPGSAGYTAIVRGTKGSTGVSVVEVYDLDTAGDAKLANISTRGLVQTGDDVLIAGTIALGPISQQVIIRAIGPSLTLPGKLENPSLELYDGDGALLEVNDDWGDSPNKQTISNSALGPTHPLESAILWTLPGNARVTAIVRGANGTTGIAIVEVYALN
ncbi:MAG: hypothetical protein QOK24_2144 [Verrucomicrobiota bacterium]